MSYRASALAAVFILGLAACEPDAADKATVVLSVEDQDEARSRHLKQALEVDTAFAEMADRDGVGAAFAAYMDAVDGQLIQPGVVLKGEEEIRTAFIDWPETTKLIWAPDGGYAASEGDLAVTTGRFKRVEEGKIVGEGRYVTVWRKNGGGDWKGVIDIGAADAPPAPPEEPAKDSKNPKDRK